MAITKKTNTHNSFSIEALNSPNWQEFNMIKTASIKKDTDLNGFDISAAIKDNPDHLFVKIFAIKEDEINDNGDCFSGSELKKAASSFVGVPIFCNKRFNATLTSIGEKSPLIETVEPYNGKSSLLVIK